MLECFPSIAFDGSLTTISLFDSADSMNHLQHIPEERFGPVLVTLNPPYEPKPELVAGRWTYHHPIVSAEVRNIVSNPILEVI